MFSNYKKIKQVINGKRYTLLIANTNDKKIKGLSGIKNMPKNTGMLFMYNVAINTICIYPSGLMYLKFILQD